MTLIDMIYLIKNFSRRDHNIRPECGDTECEYPLCPGTN